MNPLSELYLQRAENELIAAQILSKVSKNPKIQKEQFRLEKDFTFYSSVINHCYKPLLLLYILLRKSNSSKRRH